ncbi:MAG TPA: HD-GYP domain-containing protein [Thermoleophilaceae bacterium]
MTRLLALSEALARTHFGTAEHAQSVAELAERVGARLGMRGSDLRALRWGALLHDVGKIEVRRELLNKPGPLTDSEFEEIKQHTVVGALMVEQVARFGKVHQLVRWSHERWDGDGYPDGLAGVAIPLGARVISVCDAYDAMVSNRPYRSAMTSSSAVEELRLSAGTQFDPAVVDALVVEIEGGALDDARIA